MTTPDPDHQSPASSTSSASSARGTAQLRDRAYRSPAGIAGGALLVALGGWLAIDAVVRGEGRTPWVALAALLVGVPLVVAFTFRPAVFANDDRLRVCNPFRTITLPWAAVSGLRSGYSNEVFDQAGTKYQLWAVPVSLRARKKAARRRARGVASGDYRGRVPGFPGVPEGSVRSPGDQTMDELRELAERSASAAGARGEPSVRWALEILGPVGVGVVVLAVLLAV